MNRTLIAAATFGAALAALAGQADARPYLMVAADNTGFTALDLGNIVQQGIDTAQVTLISAPLAGAPYADKVAALKMDRLEFECVGDRYRLVSATYTDAKEVEVALDRNGAPWAAVGDDPTLITARDAACLRRYKANLVSRDLNLGEIVANYHRAWSPPASEPPTELDLIKRKWELSH
jgi:hypothetical protein